MSTLNHRELGAGAVVILIHGFPMNQHVWAEFAEKLSESLQVITVDLPGFGKSPGLRQGFTIEDVAAEVLLFIQEKQYISPVIVGHSLGGYVALAMAEQRPDLIAGLCLFHSTAVEDSEEKKQSRDKTLEFIARQGVEAFTSNFVGQLYADPQHSSITKVKNIAVQSSRETVAGYTLAMRNRKDRRGVLQSFPNPILFLAGEKDQGIPANSIVEQASLNPGTRAVVLPDVAHMGMFEAEATCLREVADFVRKCPVTFLQSPG